jgi:protein SCO1
MVNTTHQKSHAKLITIIIVIFSLFTAAVIYFGLVLPQQKLHDRKNVKIDGVLLPQSQGIAEFNFTDHTGKPFTKESLKGHWTMVFFGFTNCGNVCPTTLSELNTMYKTLQTQLPDKNLPQVVLISVDPDRDTISRLRDYISSFNPHFIAARADIAKTIALEKQLHIAAAKMEVNSKGKNQYTINHTAEILLFNPNAEVQAYLAYPHKADQMVKDYKLILRTTS